jgi:hypothetical protein
MNLGGKNFIARNDLKKATLIFEHYGLVDLME